MEEDMNLEDRDEASQIMMMKLSKISEVLTVLFNGWFNGMINLDARDALRSLAIWRLVDEDLRELVAIIHDEFGDGTEFEEAVRQQEEEWSAQSQRIEELIERLEGLRQNARNN